MILNSLTGTDYFPSAFLGPFWPLVCRAGGRSPHAPSLRLRCLPASCWVWLPASQWRHQLQVRGLERVGLFSGSLWLRHYPHSHTSRLLSLLQLELLLSFRSPVLAAPLPSAPLGWGGGWARGIVSYDLSLVPSACSVFWLRLHRCKPPNSGPHLLHSGNLALLFRHLFLRKTTQDPFFPYFYILRPGDSWAITHTHSAPRYLYTFQAHDYFLPLSFSPL